MAGYNPSDIMEEDAADLQFPKEDDDEIIEIKANRSPVTYRSVKYTKNTLSFEKDEIFNQQKCNKCLIFLQEPYILCNECKELFCLGCFSNGVETNKHKNSHSYIIREDDINIFNSSSWTAAEEKKLLNLLIIHGFGNWDTISKSIVTKSADECRDHYLKYYFDGIFEKTLGLISKPYFPKVIPYLYKTDSIEPPRFDCDSSLFNAMAGYRCARGDFDTPYDPSAESILSNLDLTIDNYYAENKVVLDVLYNSLFHVYNNRLKERHRRYKIMKDHGLLIVRKTIGWYTSHAEALGEITDKYTKNDRGKFLSFMQLTDPMQYDSLVEGLQYAYDLKKYFHRLCELRKNGITTFYGGKIYYKLKTKRLSQPRNKHLEQYEQILDWKTFTFDGFMGVTMRNNSIPFAPQRKKALPLEIYGLSGFDKLTEEERQLCSVVRLSPMAYLDYKNILVTENTKMGFLRLAAARRLIKIDVNKTRQLYDFLIKIGCLNKPFS